MGTESIRLRSSWLPRAILIAALALAAGCGRFGTEPPLEESGGAHICARQVTEGDLFSFGAGDTVNRSGYDAEVVKVELLDAVGMELVGAKVVYYSTREPSGNDLSVGLLGGWPPDFGDAALEAEFERADDLEGAVIPPDEDTAASFVVGVRVTQGAQTGPLRLTYRAGGRQWTWTGGITFRTAKGKTCGDFWD